MSMNRLYLGDNLSIMRSFPSDSIDLIATDPPFNTGKTQNGKIYSWRKPCESAYSDDSGYKRGKNGNNSYKNTEWHQRNKNGEWYFLSHFCNPNELYYFERMIPIIEELKRLMKRGGTLYWHCDYRTNAVYRIILNKIFGDRLSFRNELIWHYPNKTHPCLTKRSYLCNHNNVLVYTKVLPNQVLGNQLNLKEFEHLERCTVWTIPYAPTTERVGYPTQKPIELYTRIIKASSNAGDVVLDPFCGSGTTLDAAECLGRKWIGIDQSEQAIDTTEKRLRKQHGLLIEYEVERHKV